MFLIIFLKKCVTNDKIAKRKNIKIKKNKGEKI